MLELLDEFGNFLHENYADGIMNKSLFDSQDTKILWILKETNGKFSPKEWWGNKKYQELHLKSPFDGVAEKGNKRATWKPVARTAYQILNGHNAKSDTELAEALERIAVINLKKSPGNSKTDESYDAYLQAPENRKVFIEQIKRINPDVIICGNTLQKLKPEIDFKSGMQMHLNDDKNCMEQHHFYCFLNKVLINAYHPSCRMDKNDYVRIIVEAYQYWKENKSKNEWKTFEWK